MEIQDSNNNTIIPKVNENLSDNDSQILVKLIEQLLKFIFDPEYTKLNLNYFV